MVANAGVDYIFGCHSHCLQPRYAIQTDDGRVVPCLFSGGNFLSNINIKPPITKDAVISVLTIGRAESGEIGIMTEKYIPCRICSEDRGKGRMAVVPCSPGFPQELRRGYDADPLKSFERMCAILNIAPAEAEGKYYIAAPVSGDPLSAEEIMVEQGLLDAQATPPADYREIELPPVSMGEMNGPSDDHPAPVRKACESLGKPLPYYARCGKQPSHYLGKTTFGGGAR